MTAGHPKEKAEEKARKSLRQLAMASPFEAIAALLKADVGPVATAGTIKSKSIGFNTHKYLTRVENPARGHVASVDVVHSTFFWKFSFKI